MPSAIEYIPPSDERRNVFRSTILNERTRRREAYRKALDYYEGKHPKQLPVEDEEPDDNVVVNLVRMAGDRTVSFLFPEVPVFEIDPNSVDPTPEEIWLKEFFLENGGLTKLSKLALRGFLAGHCFVWIKPVPENKKNRKKPSFVVLDPTAVTVFWRADNVADVLWYELRYQVGDTVRIQDFVYNEEADEWDIYLYQNIISPTQRQFAIMDIPTSHGAPEYGSFSLDYLNFGTEKFEQIQHAKHQHYLPPIVDFPHLPHPDDYYGLGEATQIDLQNVINRVASELNRIVRENADPVDIITGADVDDVEDEGGIITISSPNAKAQRFELKGDMAGIKGTLDKLMEIYLATARVVLLKGEAKDLQRVTNASVRTLFLDALSKNALLRSSYGRALSIVSKIALLMGYAAGQLDSNPDGLDVKVMFSEPLPTDLTEIANINAIMHNLGQSMRTANTKIGNNWAFEVAAKKTEQEEAMKAQRAQMELMQEFTPEETEDESTPPED